MIHIRYLLGPMRIPFLMLTPVCVLLGLATASWTSNQINGGYFMLALVGAIAAHISVNAFNEYLDFKSGLDAQTIKTPFSGGSGTLPNKPELARPVLLMAWLAFAITALIGLYFISVNGWALVPLGLLGLAIILAYTNWITHYPLLCLIAPGLGFGPLMVMGTDFVLTGQYSWTALTASLIPLFMVSDLLLLNQFPDVEADRRAGRKHLPIAIGKSQSSLIFVAMLVLAYLTLGLGVYVGFLPAASLLGLLTLVIAIPVSYGVLKYANNTKRLAPFLGLNVAINVLTPVLMAIGMFI